jgi:hypothetical protein
LENFREYFTSTIASLAASVRRSSTEARVDMIATSTFQACSSLSSSPQAARQTPLELITAVNFRDN